MRSIDYDKEQYQDYERGRALTEQQMQAWISAFGALLPERRPLAGWTSAQARADSLPRLRERSGR